MLLLSFWQQSKRFLLNRFTQSLPRFWSISIGALLLLAMKGWGFLAFADDLVSNAAIEKYKPAIVVVQVLRGLGVIHQGTGFFVSPDGELVTNLHVVQALIDHPDARLRFVFYNGNVWDDYRIGKCHPKYMRDLCLLKLPLYPKVYFKTREALPPENTKVHVVGNPKQGHFIPASGRFLGTRYFDNASEVLIDAPFVPGFSGGPIFTSSGALVGVATLIRFNQGQAMEKGSRYGISVRELNRFVEKVPGFVSPAQYFGQP